MSERTFASLRRESRAQPETLQAKAAKALREINTMPYGEALREWLASEVYRTSTSKDAESFQKFEARRAFADEILTMMEAEHVGNGKRTD